MKIKNKKTGEIMDDAQYRNYSISDGFGFRMNGKEWEYHSLAELNEEWEDYKPVEPLIKDEKIRKAVRAWWNIQENPFVNAGILCKSYSGVPENKDHDGYYNYCLYGYVEGHNHNLTATDFEFRTKTYIEYERHRDYTLAELCGEEENGK